MTAEKWTCRLCTRPNTEVTCGYCGHPRSEQWRLPPVPGERGGAVRAGRTARVRSYVLARTPLTHHTDDHAEMPGF